MKEQLLAVMTQNKVFSVMLRGLYGMGKTVLAVAMAQLMGLYSYQIVPANGAVAISRPATVHVVDECHQISSTENLYQPMETHKFIFCTNMGSLLPEPFLSRCFQFRLEPYTGNELCRIFQNHAGNESVTLSTDVGRFLAARSKGNPRTGIMRMRKYLSLAKLRRCGVSISTASSIFDEFGIDQRGLDAIDRRYLDSLVTGPKSARTLQAILGTDKREFDRRESYLIRTRLVLITSRGRSLCLPL